MEGIGDWLDQCPYCHRGRLFQSWFVLRETCEECGARYERWAGSWTGPTVAGYGIGGVLGTGICLALHFGDRWFSGAEVVAAVIACLVVVALFRFIKATWIRMLHAWGYVFPDARRFPGSEGPTGPA